MQPPAPAQDLRLLRWRIGPSAAAGNSLFARRLERPGARVRQAGLRAARLTAGEARQRDAPSPARAKPPARFDPRHSTAAIRAAKSTEPRAPRSALYDSWLLQLPVDARTH